MKINKAEYYAILRTDFVAFAQKCFAELNPETPYLHGSHIDVIAGELEQCRAGRLNRLIINLPPRSLKSHLASIAFPAWLLGHNPSVLIIDVSYAQDLSDKLATDCRSIMTTTWYQEIFPGTRLTSPRCAVNDFTTTAKGGRLSTSVGGVLTGRGADFVIIDDPLKPEEAISETQRQALNRWNDNTLVSRLNNKREGCIIIIQQRLHEDDLVGHVLPQGNWKLLKFPAIAEEDEEYVVQTPYGQKTISRRAGEALHPAREPLEILNSIRQVQGEYNFSAQFQQRPTPLAGGLVKTAWFKRYSPDDLPKEFSLVFQSWDCACKASELSDFSACTSWGADKNRLYLLDVMRKRLDYPELKKTVVQQARDFNASNVIIEDRSAGTQLIQELIAAGTHGVVRYAPKDDKVMRMHSASSTIENGFVHIPVEAPWLAEYLHEMAMFPNAKYDDQVDSTSQALDWFRQHGADQQFGLLEYFKLEQAKLAAGTSRSMFTRRDALIEMDRRRFRFGRG